MSPQEILRTTWGHPAFRGAQADVVDRALKGQDQLVVMPTGGGKSVCFQIPALARPGLAVVVSPLLSLMRDQVEALRANGVAAAALNSANSAEEGRAIWEQARSGALKLLYVSPERLLSAGMLERLAELPLNGLAIDEAHCMSQWGPDFRPDYARLGLARAALKDVPTMALTATADPATRADIVVRLGLVDPHVTVAGFDRPNIRYMIEPKNSAPKQILRFVKARPGESGIVYCLSRKKVEDVAALLVENGVRAAAYHAGLPQAERDRVQTAFQEDAVEVVCATVAFGMGIDKPDVRYVLHRDLPKSVEAYYQETGRAGRDGEAAEARLFFSLGDVIALKKMIEDASDPVVRRIEGAKLEAMAEIAGSFACRRRALRAYFGEVVTEPCGNCDVCLDPPETFDATAWAVDALTTVHGTGQRHPLGRLDDLMRGRRAEEGVAGTYREMTERESLHRLRQLVLMGYLRIDLTQNGAAKLTPAVRPVLREGVAVTMAHYREIEKPKRDRDRGTPVMSTDEEALFDRLRALRKEIADAAQVPAYVVFDNKTLHEIAVRRPKTLASLSAIPGIGAKKLADYGDRFLAAVADG